MIFAFAAKQTPPADHIFPQPRWTSLLGSQRSGSDTSPFIWRVARNFFRGCPTLSPQGSSIFGSPQRELFHSVRRFSYVHADNVDQRAIDGDFVVRDRGVSVALGPGAGRGSGADRLGK